MAIYSSFYPNQPFMAQPTPQNIQPVPQYRMDFVYVTGLQGANAYQMPAGVQQMILWDTDNDSFYIKKLDEFGRPRVVAHKDFFDHVEREAAPAQPIDTSSFVTRKDLDDILSKIQVNLSGFLTKPELDKALSELSVGEKGKVVRLNELDS